MQANYYPGYSDNFIQCSGDTSKILFGSVENAPKPSYGRSVYVLPWRLGYDGYLSTFLNEDRILVSTRYYGVRDLPGLCRVGSTYNTSLVPNRWANLFQWFDNAPCYWCKTFNSNANEMDGFARASFSDSLNGFVQSVDNGKYYLRSHNFKMQIAIYNTIDGGESFQNGTLFTDTSLVLNPYSLISTPKPGLCFFLTDACKLFKTTDYGQSWQVLNIRNRNINSIRLNGFPSQGEVDELTSISASDENHIWLSFGDTLYTTSNGGGTGWQPYTQVIPVNNVRLYMPGRINLPPLSGISSSINAGTNKIQAWYNPDKSEVSVQMEKVVSGANIPLQISDVMGRTISELELQPTLDVQTFQINLPTGIYLLNSPNSKAKIMVW